MFCLIILEETSLETRGVQNVNTHLEGTAMFTIVNIDKFQKEILNCSYFIKKSIEPPHWGGTNAYPEANILKQRCMGHNDHLNTHSYGNQKINSLWTMLYL